MDDKNEQVAMPCYMMATTAIHNLGDISSDVPDLCRIREEKDSNYIGEWVLGLGFINVKFPKETTRLLTAEEIDYYNSKSVRIGSQPAVQLNVD